jgi:hypothetical protein
MQWVKTPRGKSLTNFNLSRRRDTTEICVDNHGRLLDTFSYTVGSSLADNGEIP